MYCDYVSAGTHKTFNVTVAERAFREPLRETLEPIGARVITAKNRVQNHNYALLSFPARLTCEQMSEVSTQMGNPDSVQMLTQEWIGPIGLKPLYEAFRSELKKGREHAVLIKGTEVRPERRSAIARINPFAPKGRQSVRVTNGELVFCGACDLLLERGVGWSTHDRSALGVFVITSEAAAQQIAATLGVTRETMHLTLAGEPGHTLGWASWCACVDLPE